LGIVSAYRAMQRDKSIGAWQIPLLEQIFTCKANAFGNYVRAAWQGAGRHLANGF
jgi:hypothetical protein